jgi:hypothetical protein
MKSFAIRELLVLFSRATSEWLPPGAGSERSNAPLEYSADLFEADNL